MQSPASPVRLYVRVGVFAGVVLLVVAGSAYAAVRVGSGPTFTSTLVAAHSDKCLSAPQKARDVGSSLRQRACADESGQRFQFTRADDDAYEVRTTNGSCVEVRGARRENGAPVVQRSTCDGRASQLFSLRPIAGQPASFMLVAKHSGKCLDVFAGRNEDGTPVMQWSCGDARVGNQIWRVDGAVDVGGTPVASTGTVNTPTPTASSTGTGTLAPAPAESAPSGGSRAGGNADWSKAAPPEGAELSRAYALINGAKDKGYQPRDGECSSQTHARYWTWGPDGKVYPTWHPARDASGCTFGHEHGDDPRDADLFAKTGWPAFGFTNEQLAPSDPAKQRDEDHVGHKVSIGNNVEVRKGSNAESGNDDSGPLTMTCDTLLKFHQGTHSPDALSNNLHELLYNARCKYADNGEVIETRFSALLPLGHAGAFTATQECAGNQSTEREVKPPVPANSPDSPFPGRLIPDAVCAAAVKAGDKDVLRMNEIWIAGVFGRSGQLRKFQLFPFFFVANPSRFFDPESPDKIGRHLDLCYEGASGFLCDQVRRTTDRQGKKIAWNDPQSPFNGAQRLFSPGLFVVQNEGPTTVYTDVFAKRFSSTPFPGAIEQYIAGNHAGDRGQGEISGKFRNYAANSSDRIHAPN
jgi:hypothetical protein